MQNVAKQGDALRGLRRNMPSTGRSVCLFVRRVYCGKTADWIWIPFGVVSGVNRGIGVLDGGEDHRMERGNFGTLLRSCTKS